MYMKQYERSKIILLKEVTNALEMASYIESLKCAAIIYCEQECPEEIIYNSSYSYKEYFLIVILCE